MMAQIAAGLNSNRQEVKMKAIILDGSQTNDMTGERVRMALMAQLEVSGWEVEHVIIRDQKIGWTRMSPVSRPSSICIMVTPDTVSPASMARGMGAAPRQRGSREACTLTQPWTGVFRMDFGRIWP